LGKTEDWKKGKTANLLKKIRKEEECGVIILRRHLGSFFEKK